MNNIALHNAGKAELNAPLFARLVNSAKHVDLIKKDLIATMALVIAVAAIASYYTYY